jgi:hypothetical protein
MQPMSTAGTPRDTPPSDAPASATAAGTPANAPPGESPSTAAPPGGASTTAPMSDPATTHSQTARPDEPGGTTRRTRNMLPARDRRRFGLERAFVRLIATGGVVGIGVALGAILAASKVQGWIIGLVVALLSVVLSAVLWSSRQL